MDKRRISLYLVIGFLLGSAGIVAATHINGTAPVSDGVTITAADGMAVNLTGSTDVQMENMFPDSQTVELTTEAGNITFASSDPADARIDKSNITGTWTSVTNMFVTGSDVTINPEDKARVKVGKDIEYIKFRDANIDDGNADFVYAGASGTSKVTLYTVPADTRIAAIDKDSNQILDESRSNSNGHITFTDLTNSEHTVELQTFDPASPTFDNASPQGDLDNEPSQISVDVNDGDFPQGDEVQVNISLDGSQIHSENITSNSTVTTNIPQSGQTGGSHNWNVVAKDSYGETSTDAYSYSVPDTFYIRNESNHSEIIDSPVDNTVRFFGEEQTYERTTSDGTINMTGLPVNQDFIVEVEPTGNYTSRTVYIQSIYEQQNAYLLNTSAYADIDTRFELNDPTGQYGSDTVLFIQKPINISGTTTWQTIHADEFGVEGVTATLQEDQRYRIKVKSAEGTSQIIGPYRSDVSETVTVSPGTPTIALGEFEDGWAWNAGLDNRTLEYTYADPQMDTDQVTVWIHERNNESNLLQPNETYFNLGNFSAITTLTENESETAWVVNFVVDRNGEIFTVQTDLSNRPTLIPELDDVWRLVIGVGSLIFLAGAFSLLNASVGAVVVSIVGGIMWWIGFLPGATTGAAIVIAIFISVLAHIYSGSKY